MTLLVVQDLSVSVGSSRLLRGVGLTVPRGCVVGLAGRSGAGKTTLAHAVLRLLPAGAVARGRILLDGEDVLGMSWTRLRAVRWSCMALVVQDSLRALDPLRRVVDQVVAPVRLHRRCGRAEARRLALDVLAEVGLEGRQVAARPHELSGGQRQRALLAIALVLQPALLVADEPTTDLDTAAEAALLDLLTDRVRRHGTGLLLISHDVAMLARRSDHLTLLHAGAVVEDGPTSRVVERPRHSSSRRLLTGSAVMAPRPVRSDARPVVLAVQRLTVRAAGRAGADLVVGADLVLRVGEIVALVGPSGVGKTTLARTLAGLHPPAVGAVLLDGVAPSASRADVLRHRRSVQYLPQNAAQTLNPAHSVGRAVSEGLRIHRLGSPPYQDDVRDALTAVALPADPAFAGRCTTELSTGQRQRVALAAAVAVRPRVVLADEPTSGLDVSARAGVLQVLATLARDHGTAVLLITHDVVAVQAVADRVLRLAPSVPGEPAALQPG